MSFSKWFRRIVVLFLFFFPMFDVGYAQSASYQLALLQYTGGNWYVSPTALPNLIAFTNKNLHTNINSNPATVEAGSPEIFNYPFVFMTGNGDVFFDNQAVSNLRKYLESGGFLLINDSYGMDLFVRREMKKVFPDKELVALPPSFPIYHQQFDFPNGLPKIHKHNGKPPMGYGIFINGRLAVYYDYESDIGDGWEDPEVHNDPPNKRLEALKMGADILQFVFSGVNSATVSVKR